MEQYLMSNGTKPANLISFTALVLSVVAVLGMLFVIGLPFAITAIILSHISLWKIKRSGGVLPGYGLSLASLVMGYLSALVSTLILVVGLVYVIPTYRKMYTTSAVRKEVEKLAKARPEERYDAIIKKLSVGKQVESEDMLVSLVRTYPEDQRLAFMQAVCSRSRWAKSRAAWQFQRVLDMGPTTLEGNCSRYVLEIDKRKNVEANMNGLRLLIKEHPENPFLLWVTAVVGHDNFKLTNETTYSRESAEYYKKLLKMFEIGPVMLHQTFANVLSEELSHHAEALKHRRKAVELEPASWTYQGLANTLSELRQYDEANKTFEKIVEMDPDDAHYWYSWACSLCRQKCYSGCIAKCEKVLELDKSDYWAFTKWGYCLEMLGDLEGALKKYDQAIAVDPAKAFAYDAATRLLMVLNRPAEAEKYHEKMRNIPGNRYAPNSVNNREQAENNNPDIMQRREANQKRYEVLEKAVPEYVRILDTYVDNISPIFFTADWQLIGEMSGKLNIGTSTNYSEGIKQLNLAVSNRNLIAAYYTIVCLYKEIHGYNKDSEKAQQFFKEGFPSLLQGADNACAQWQYALGVSYQQSLGTKIDKVEAVRWLNKSAEQGYIDAQFRLGMCYENGQGMIEDYFRAVKWYRKAAEQGHAKAQYCMGWCYNKGEGVETNAVEAITWYRKSAEQGEALAQFMLGLSYAKGRGVAKDFTEAVKWYRKAAEQGYADAQLNLGICYKKGEGVEKNFIEAAKYYRNAAEQGNANAQVNLGSCYAKGQGELEDFSEAVRWYRKAAEQGHPDAQFNLGLCYAQGRGVTRDVVEAVKWYRKAAEQQCANANAQLNLGVCYKKGEGVERNLVEAATWYRKSSEHGIAKAQYYLGECYAKGEGVPVSYPEAYKWYLIASTNGINQANEKKQELEKFLSPSQIEAIKRVARSSVVDTNVIRK